MDLVDKIGNDERNENPHNRTSANSSDLGGKEIEDDDGMIPTFSLWTRTEMIFLNASLAKKLPTTDPIEKTVRSTSHIPTTLDGTVIAHLEEPEFEPRSRHF